MTARRHFVTHCDHRYLPKALALHASLKQHHPSFVLWMVCTSEAALEQLLAMPDETRRPVALAEIEDAYPQLRVAKTNRTAVEYYYTLSPAVCRFVLDQPECPDMVTYVDADLFFFSSPEAVFELLGPASVGITPHRFSFWIRSSRRGGAYNVGWITFRRDADGMACLLWWFERCIEWCYQRYEDGKYADQGYLDWFPKSFRGVRVLDDPGINLAPWNLANYRVHRGRGGVEVDGRPVVFFHFADFRQLSRWHYSTNTSGGLLWLTPRVRQLIFRPYVETLRRISPGGLPSGLRRLRLRDLVSLRVLRESARMIRNIMFMQYIFVVGNRII